MSRSSEEIKREILRCVRVAAREKSDFRISKLQGFLNKLKNESKIRRWGRELERQYEIQVIEERELWDAEISTNKKNINYLWANFGLGDAHTHESVYSDIIAINVLSTWIISLYPSIKISSSDLADQVRRIGINNAQAYERAQANGNRFHFPLPIDQLVRDLSQNLGPYA